MCWSSAAAAAACALLCAVVWRVTSAWTTVYIKSKSGKRSIHDSASLLPSISNLVIHFIKSPFPRLFPKQFTVGVLNAVLSVSALAGVLCPPRWACLPICLPICLASGFVFHLGWGAVSASLGFPQTVYCWGSQCCLKCVRLGWDAVSASLVSSSSCLRFCLPTRLPSWLGRCVRLPGLGFLLSPVLSPNLSPILAGALRPPPWSRLSLASGFVSQLVPHLGWGAASASLVSAFSCLRSCLPTCLWPGTRCPPP